MKASWKMVVGFVFAMAVAVGMGMPQVHAAPASVATFTLPFDASLGKLALPAGGDYRISIDRLRTGAIVSLSHGRDNVGFLLSQEFNPDQNQGQNPVLVFIRHDGTATLRAFRVPGTGTFYFPLPKGLDTLVASQPQLIETVTVEVNGY